MTVQGSYNSYICHNQSAMAPMQHLMSHLVEVRNFCDVHKIYNSEVLDFLSNRVQSLVHRHTLAIPIMAKANDDDAIFF